MDPKGATRTYLLKPASAAAVASAGAYLWRGNAPVNVPGVGATSFPLLVGGATFIAAEAASLINDYLFPHIPVINAVSTPAHAALNVGTIALGTMAVENYYAPGLSNEQGFGEIGLLAAAAEVGGTYLCDELLVPMLNNMSSSGHL